MTRSISKMTSMRKTKSGTQILLITKLLCSSWDRPLWKWPRAMRQIKLFRKSSRTSSIISLLSLIQLNLKIMRVSTPSRDWKRGIRTWSTSWQHACPSSNWQRAGTLSAPKSDLSRSRAVVFSCAQVVDTCIWVSSCSITPSLSASSLASWSWSKTRHTKLWWWACSKSRPTHSLAKRTGSRSAPSKWMINLPNLWPRYVHLKSVCRSAGAPKWIKVTTSTSRRTAIWICQCDHQTVAKVSPCTSRAAQPWARQQGRHVRLIAEHSILNHRRSSWVKDSLQQWWIRGKPAIHRFLLLHLLKNLAPQDKVKDQPTNLGCLASVAIEAARNRLYSSQSDQNWSRPRAMKIANWLSPWKRRRREQRNQFHPWHARISPSPN